MAHGLDTLNKMQKDYLDGFGETASDLDAIQFTPAQPIVVRPQPQSTAPPAQTTSDQTSGTAQVAPAA